MDPAIHAASQRLAGRVALITGGASGIGLACAERFLAEGARVMLADIQPAAGAAALERLSAQSDADRMAFHAADCSRGEPLQALVDATLARFGGIDICVCSAGVGDRPAPFHETSEAEFDRVLGINLKGPFLLGQLVARHMLATGRRGAIVHVSSVGGMLAVPQVPSYCVSKAGLGMLTKVMAVTLAPQGIRVNAVAPGPTNTAMQAGPSSTAASQAMRLRTPLGRPAEAQEIAAVAAFLASDDASYITGQTLYADGGRLALNYTMPLTP